MAYSHTRLSILVAALALGLAPGVTHAADRGANAATLGSVFAAAQPGDRILLESGSYGTFGGAQKSGTVTIRPAPGATASMRLELNGASNLRFEGITVTGATISASTRNVAVVGSRFTGMATLRDGPGMNILFDGNTHDDIDVCGDCSEARIHITGGTGNRTPNGIVISNSHFGGGNSDGIQTGGYGTQIGPGNEFENIMQGDASVAHTDPIQLYGSQSTHIVGNFLHDNTTTIMAPDGPSRELIEHNVIVANHDNRAVNLGSDTGSIVRHNTLIGIIMYKRGNTGGPSTGSVLKDNIVTEGIVRTDGSTPAEEDYNLIVSGPHAGAHDRGGQPVFIGGAAPGSWAGYRLAPGSPGKGAASDGADMGALFGDPVPPAGAPPTPQGGGPASPGPTITMLRPSRGAVLHARLHAAAKAADDSGISRIDLWLDRRHIASDTAAPYRWKRRFARVRRGTHTLTARAFANDGQVSSVAVTVRRRAGRAVRRSGRRGGWRVRTSPVAEGTVLRGRGPARSSVRVALTACGDAEGRRVRRVRLRTDRKGNVRAVRRAGSLCVLSLRRK